MINVIHRTDSVARKEYYDDAWEFISEWIYGGCYIDNRDKPLTFAEKRKLVLYRNKTLKGSKILKGELYHRQFNEFDGATYTWRTKKFFYDLACRYDLFPEI